MDYGGWVHQAELGGGASDSLRFSNRLYGALVRGLGFLSSQDADVR